MEPVQQRQSYTALGEIYFWTATIHQWLHLPGSGSNNSMLLALYTAQNNGYGSAKGYAKNDGIVKPAVC